MPGLYLAVTLIAALFSPVPAVPFTVFNTTFPHQRSPVLHSVRYSREELNCFNREKVYYDGACYNLLEKGPCGEGEWIVLDVEFGPGIRPKCEAPKCKRNKVWWPPSGDCVKKDHPKVCRKKGTVLGADAFGEGACLCLEDEPRAMHHNGACYRLYSRGPCEEGGMYVEPYFCVPDVCGNKNGSRLVPWGKDGKCYSVGKRGPCRKGQVLKIDWVSLKPECFSGCTGRGDCDNGNGELRGLKYMEKLIKNAQRKMDREKIKS